MVVICWRDNSPANYIKPYNKQHHFLSERILICLMNDDLCSPPITSKADVAHHDLSVISKHSSLRKLRNGNKNKQSLLTISPIRSVIFSSTNNLRRISWGIQATCSLRCNSWVYNPTSKWICLSVHQIVIVNSVSTCSIPRVFLSNNTSVKRCNVIRSHCAICGRISVISSWSRKETINQSTK